MIFYKVLDDGIEILRVVTGRRNFPSLFEESNKLLRHCEFLVVLS
ncbi:hypothetical protein [uncultured Nostoc sp.]